ncbi:chemotaxis protein CheA [Oceanisphaera arctica]|uniref:Chemotaxis protein CheA n=1 Tax=Oceanisphaera arctica TaxID=641510 RepID=A0A2P5TMT0_9GAMM|nr:chemotaxis protein CheA [Oceanisphaera arctica]PPL16733.1 chemotaxis protein CheA [Oceanisphaera arctica]GHA06223.1 chemotaxis protein CheA [Oceanisphaera arctica]
MDFSDFYDTFFEEADELLDEMERQLLALDLDKPDPERLNAIFRAAHSIKGGAGTFGFSALQGSTHLLENLLDCSRRGVLILRRDIIDIFLVAKDMLQDQLDDYRQGQEPDPDTYQRICQMLQQMALEQDVQLDNPEATSVTSASTARLEMPVAADPEPIALPASMTAPMAQPEEEVSSCRLLVTLLGVTDQDYRLLLEELTLFGELVEVRELADGHEVLLDAQASADDIAAVMCFILEPDQLKIRVLDPRPELPLSAVSPEAVASVASAAREAAAVGTSLPTVPELDFRERKGVGEALSLRVPVAKIDQLIKLVDELMITHSMLVQTISELDGGTNGGLVNGMNLLQRNARDLQKAVMSVRMVPMGSVFGRFPRLVRDLAGSLDKEVELVTLGESTELDKSLIERIIDPLTHLVRNSLDHGIERPDIRVAAGKPATGRLTLSARQQGGNILIEVKDDGAGLNRSKLLARVRANGLNVSDTMSDDEVWQLIFAPGFSTAEQISDVSGRGVGMDVVKRNIQAIGGHVELQSRPGQGTSTRIVLPLTLAILEGMLIKVGGEVFILPLSSVIESLQPTTGILYTVADQTCLLKVREEYLPLVAVRQVLNVNHARTRPTDCIAVVVQGEGRRYALLVDELLGQQQVVVKNLETNYCKVPGISAATILGDGRMALILDIVDMHRLSHVKTASEPFRGGLAQAVGHDSDNKLRK